MKIDIFFTALVLVGIALICIVIWGIFIEDPRKQEELSRMTTACEIVGGSILDRTYTVNTGRHVVTRSNYTCIDKKVILEIK